MTCYAMYAECTKREVCAQPMLLFLVPFCIDSSACTLQKQSQGYTMKPELAKYETRPFTKRKEHLFNTTQTPTEKKREGGHSKKKRIETRTPKSPTSRTLYLRFSKKTPHYTTPPTFLGLGGLNARRKKTRQSKTRKQLTHSRHIQNQTQTRSIRYQQTTAVTAWGKTAHCSTRQKTP